MWKFCYLVQLWVFTQSVVYGNNIGNRQDENPGYFLLSANKIKGSSIKDLNGGAETAMHVKKSVLGEDEISMDLHNSHTFYTTDISIGSDLQNITLFIELSKNEILILPKPFLGLDEDDDEDYSDLRSREEQQYKASLSHPNYYSPSLSDTYEFISENDTALDAFSTPVSWSRDDIIIESIKVEGAVFGLVNSLWCSQSDICPLFELGEHNITGILGLGMPNQEILPVYPTEIYASFPMQLKSLGITKSVSYSLFLDEPSANSANLLFGAVDHARYTGDLVLLPFTPFFNSGVPQVTLNSISVIDTGSGEEQLIANGAVVAALDTTQAISSFPADVFGALISTFPYSYSNDTRLDNIPCSFAENKFFNFNFQGQDIKVPLSSFLDNIVGSDGELSTMCMLNIALIETSPATSDDPVGASSVMLLGDSFMRYVYMVADAENEQIGLAQANFDYEGSDIEIINDSVPGAFSALDSQAWANSDTILIPRSKPASSLTRNIDDLDKVVTDIVQTITINSVSEVLLSSSTKHSVQHTQAPSTVASASVARSSTSTSSFNSVSSISSQTQTARGNAITANMRVVLLDIIALLFC